MTVPTVVLNPSTPDFDSILSQFETALSSQGAWNNLLTSATGQTLLRFMASATALEMGAVERAQQETILDTARLSSSILRIARMLGNHIQRRNPGQIDVTVTLTDATLSASGYSIPAYTPFALGGIPLFNRTALVFLPGQLSVTSTFYVGSVQSVSVVSDGTQFQNFQIGPADYSLSDQDIYATVDGEIWSKTTLGLWRYTALDKVFYENTLPNGQVAIMFGNGIYGSMPPAGATISFNYVSVLPTSDQNVPTGTNITSSITGVTAVSTGGLSGYQDALPASFYKMMGPSIFSANERAVTRSDHKALTLQYPGVIDCVWLGQAEINPGDLRWMNVVQATLLTESPWSDFDWQTFVNWYQTQVGMSTVQVVRKDPESVNLTLDISIYCFNRASLSNVQLAAQQFITNYFAKKVGSLGANYQLSDLINGIKDGITDNEGSLIDYITIQQPTNPIVLRPTQWLSVTNPTVNMYYSTRGNPRVLTIAG